MKQKSLSSLNMFWRKFNYYLPIISSFSFLLFFFSCSSNQEKDKKEKDNKMMQENTLSEEEKIIRQVENKLDITAAEEYDIQIKYRFINPDSLKDALILVNRKDYAFQQAKKNQTERFFENTGHTGLHNHVFLKLGGDNKLISTTPVGSNVEFPLEVEFLELTSKAHQDFYVEYRIKNSKHRNYYTLRDKNLFLTFSCPVFDSIGVSNPRVYAIQHPNSSVRIAKDIALYQGKIVDYHPDSIEDINSYEPKDIISTEELFAYFIFDEKSMKYKTPMPAIEK